MLRKVLIAALTMSWLGWAATVTLLPTAPGQPVYLNTVTTLLSLAEQSVDAMLSDCRYYDDLAIQPVFALAAAASRGVEVRVIVDRSKGRSVVPEQEKAVQYLEAHGVKVQLDDPEVTLHAKLLIVDRRFVIVGSSHWTWNALFGSVQVDLLIESAELAWEYTRFFDYVWKNQGSAKVSLAEGDFPAPALLPLAELPGSELHLAIIEMLLSEATTSVELFIYRLGYYPYIRDSQSNRLISALIDASRRGVHVRVLLEGGEEFMDEATIQGNREAAAFLLLHGVEVRLDPLGETMHAKCLIVDEKHVLVSSANWSYYSLVKNVEAGVAVLGAPELAREVRAFFEVVWARARSPFTAMAS